MRALSGKSWGVSAATLAMLWILSPVLPAVAQEPSGAADTAPVSRADRSTIEEITVTARHREENLQSVPIAVTALSGSELENGSINDLKDIDKLAPNINFHKSSVSKFSAEVFMRGVGQINWAVVHDPKVGTYVDGVYIARPQGALFDLVDLERVEVLRGPQGTLFGKNTIGGLIHVVSKKPTNDFGAQLKAGLGSDDQWSYDARVNFPIIEDVLMARAAFQTKHSDGYMKNSWTGEKWNDKNSQAGRLSLRWVASENIEVMLTGDWYKAREKPNLFKCFWVAEPGFEPAPNTFHSIFWGVPGIADEVEAACKRSQTSGDYVSGNVAGNDANVNVRGLNGTVTWDLGWAEFTSISAYRQTRWRNATWSSFWGDSNDWFLDVIEPEYSDHKQWSQEFRLQGLAFDDRFAWVAGVFGFREEGYQPFTVPLYDSTGIGAPPALAPTLSFLNTIIPFALNGPDGAYGFSRVEWFEALNKSGAAFFEGTYDITEKLSFTAGVRYTFDAREHSRYVMTYNRFLIDDDIPVQPFTQFCQDPGEHERNAWGTGVYGPGGGAVGPKGQLGYASPCKRTARFDAWTPRFILSYQFTDEIMGYFGYSRGYQSGGIDQNERTIYDPEYAKNWEGGLKTTLLDGKLVMNLAAFFQDYDDIQFNVGRIINGTPVVIVLNAGKSDIRGIELDFQASPIPGLLLRGSAGYLDADYREFLDLNQQNELQNFSDRYFPLVPQHTYSLSATYTMELPRGFALTTYAGWKHQSEMYMNIDDQRRHSRSGKIGKMDLRLTLALPNDRTQLSFWVTNALDRYTWQRGGGTPDETGSISRQYDEPRRVGFEVTHQFGDY